MICNEIHECIICAVTVFPGCKYNGGRNDNKKAKRFFLHLKSHFCCISSQDDWVEELIPSPHQAETGPLRYALTGTWRNPNFCFHKRPPHVEKAQKTQPKSSAPRDIEWDKPSGIWEGSFAQWKILWSCRNMLTFGSETVRLFWQTL